MAHGFDVALINRERDRLRLAEALDSKYEQEARRRTVARLLVLSIVGFFAYIGFRGTQVINNLVSHPGIAKKQPLPDPGILAQMKKQAQEGDALLAGAESQTEAPSEPRRSRANRDDFSGKPPLHLYSELTRSPSAGGGRLPYDPPGGRWKHELDELNARAARRAPVDYGKYRPGVATDLPKLPPPRAPKTAPPAALYAQLPAPPAALSPDDHEFPLKK